LPTAFLLLTGVPGIGKTTIIRRIADRLKNRRIGGFYTEEIREDGDRRGFRLVGFDGTKRVIGHVDFPEVHRSGSTASTSEPSTRRYIFSQTTRPSRFISSTRSAKWSVCQSGM
jgi:nucleoside-triphosphatase THEP1